MKKTDPLLNQKDLEDFIAMLRNQLESSKKEREQLLQMIAQSDTKIAQYEQSLQALLTYYDFVNYKGFSIVNQFIDEHREEIEQANKERMSEKVRQSEQKYDVYDEWKGDTNG